MEVTFREEFDAPVERVFHVFTDIDGAPKWLPNLIKIEKLTPGPFAKGTQWRETRKMFGKAATETFEVTAFEPGRGFELFIDGSKGATGRGEFRFSYRFEAANAKSVMRVQGVITGLGCMGTALGWLFKGMIKKMIAKDHEAVRKYLQSAT